MRGYTLILCSACAIQKQLGEGRQWSGFSVVTLQEAHSVIRPILYTCLVWEIQAKVDNSVC